MSSIVAYHRPNSLGEAVELLAQSGRSILAGGTAIVPEARSRRADGVELIDLQALQLDGISETEGRLTLGAMVRLGDLATDDRAGELINDLARRELPSAMRNQATVGGTVASASPDSVLIAGLLVHDAQVEFHDGRTSSLSRVLSDGTNGAIIVAVSIDPTGSGSIVATGRTPADLPIVAAVARSTDGGPRLAITGASATVVEVDPSEPTAGLEPPSDFRGSSGYRLELADTLSQRVLKAVS